MVLVTPLLLSVDRNLLVLVFGLLESVETFYRLQLKCPLSCNNNNNNRFLQSPTC
jgi:hypothetical protein